MFNSRSYPLLCKINFFNHHKEKFFSVDLYMLISEANRLFFLPLTDTGYKKTLHIVGLSTTSAFYPRKEIFLNQLSVKDSFSINNVIFHFIIDKILFKKLYTHFIYQSFYITIWRKHDDLKHSFRERQRTTQFI